MSTSKTLERLWKRNPKIALRKLNKRTILIEGNPAGLKYLGHLLIAHADSSDCGDQMSPTGAGSRLFSKGATLGLYLHRVPFEHERRN